MTLTSSLQGRRVLVTHTIVQSPMDSTLLVLDVATWLLGNGADVVVYAAFVDEPMSRVFADRGLTVVDESSIGELDTSTLDVVWVQSQVLPLAVIDALSVQSPAKLPVFIFNHMSGDAAASDEHPYIPDLEARLSSLSLFASERVREQLAPSFAAQTPTMVFQDSIPAAGAATSQHSADALRRVLVMSGHRDKQFEEGIRQLGLRGCSVDVFGETSRDVFDLRAETLQGYDLVVATDRVARYAVAAGVPVYVYGPDGGYGYLSDANIATVVANQFAVDGAPVKRSDEFAKDVLSGFADGRSFQSEHSAELGAGATLEQSLPDVFERAQSAAKIIEPFDVTYASQVRAAQRFAARHFMFWGWLKQVEHSRDLALKDIEDLRAEARELRTAPVVVKASDFEQKVVAPLNNVYEFLRELFRR